MSASGPPQLVQLDCNTLADIANRFSPILRFHPEERFFPVLAESWLTHTTEAPWWDDTAHQLGDISLDPNHRGMALCRFTNGDLDVIAGQPVAGDRPLQLSVADADPYAIGAPALKTVDGMTFLDLAGWAPASNFGAGDTERLYALYSELSAAMTNSSTGRRCTDSKTCRTPGSRPRSTRPPTARPCWPGAFTRSASARVRVIFRPVTPR
jgi:hypothetical protein